MRLFFFGVFLFSFAASACTQTLSEDLKDYQTFSKLRRELVTSSRSSLNSSHNITVDTWLVPYQGEIANPFVMKTWQLELAHYFIVNKKWVEAKEVVFHLLGFQKDSVIYPKALKQLIEIELHLKNKSKVLQLYGDLLAQFQDPDPEQELWKKIQAFFGNKLSIVDCFYDSATFLGYIQNLAKNDEHLAVIEQAKKFMAIYPRSRYVGDLAFLVGNAYFELHYYMPAIAAFERTQFLSTDSNLISRSYYLTGKSWLYLQSPRKAYPQFCQAVKLYRNSEYEPFCLYELCKLLRTYGPNKEYQYYSKLFSQRYSNHEAYRAMLWEAKWEAVETASSQETSSRFYTQFKEEMGREPVLSEKILRFYKATLGSNLNKLGDYILEIPLSYYAYNVLLHSVLEEKAIKSSEGQIVADKFLTLSQGGFEKMALEGLHYEQAKKSNGWGSRENDIYYLYAQLMFVLKKGTPHKIINMLQNRLDPEAVTYGSIPKLLIKLYYPKVYWPTIVKFSAKYQVDPYLVLAIMREESFFNPYAKSRVNALGLMQLRSRTARDISFRTGQYWKGDTSLFDPETNIRLAVYYVSWLKKQFSGSTIYAIAAYNAGPESVRKWRLTRNAPNFEDFLTNVTYPETREYLRKVVNSYVIYKILYSE